MSKQTQYSLAFRERAIRRMKLGDNVSKLARELGVDRTTLYGWKRKLEKRRYRKLADQEPDWRDHRIEELEAKITRLERIIGGQWSELDFFESALRRVDGKARKSGGGKKAWS
jgi:transposase-like protein